jgi:hypothetical protein
MAQNYTQPTYTQAVVARRNADAILTIARFAAAIPVSPAPLFDVEKLEGSRRGRAPQRFGVHGMSWRARPRSRRPSDGRESYGEGGPGRSATAERSAGNRACADRYS